MNDEIRIINDSIKIMKKILVLLFFVIFFLPLVSSTFAENIAVIVNENSPAPASLLTAAEIKNIKDIYLGKVKYWNKQVIKPANQREENIFSTFIKKVCEMNLNEYRSYWVRYALETGLSAPQMRETVKDVINYVQANVSAVGYLWESEAKDLKGVKVILVLT